jgi:hypothetical protein
LKVRPGPAPTHPAPEAPTAHTQAATLARPVARDCCRVQLSHAAGRSASALVIAALLPLPRAERWWTLLWRRWASSCRAWTLPQQTPGEMMNAWSPARCRLLENMHACMHIRRILYATRMHARARTHADTHGNMDTRMRAHAALRMRTSTTLQAPFDNQLSCAWGPSARLRGPPCTLAPRMACHHACPMSTLSGGRSLYTMGACTTTTRRARCSATAPGRTCWPARAPCARWVRLVGRCAAGLVWKG